MVKLALFKNANTKKPQQFGKKTFEKRPRVKIHLWKFAATE